MLHKTAYVEGQACNLRLHEMSHPRVAVVGIGRSQLQQCTRRRAHLEVQRAAEPSPLAVSAKARGRHCRSHMDFFSNRPEWRMVAEEDIYDRSLW